MDFDTTVKLTIYETIANTAKAPTSAEIAAALHSSIPKVEAAFQRLHQKRLLVPEPGHTSHIRMAPPFAGIVTPHLVNVRGKSYYANCAWDALGVAAALHRDADIESSCADCGQLLFFQVRNGQPVARECAIHFAVPAAHWWDDIIYT
jgi:hypothetical protein